MDKESLIRETLMLLLLIRFSRVQLCATLWTAAHQAPLSTAFSRQEYWSGLPFSPPGDLPDPGMEPVSLTSPALAGRIFTPSATWEALLLSIYLDKTRFKEMHALLHL